MEKSPRPGRSPGRFIPPLLALAAVLIWSRHLDWGLPDVEEEAFPMKKAFEMCGWGTGKVQLDPRTAGWPSLSFYVHMLVQHVQYGLGRLTGDFADRGDFFLLGVDMTSLAVWARWVGVLSAGAVVLAGARIGRRLAGPAGAVLAGLALLTSPLLARHAQQITPDILLVMFAALALERIVGICEEGRRRDYLWAGIWIGLGISAKYTPVFLLPSLYLAHLLRRRTEGARPRRLGLGDRRLWWAAAACVLAFTATSPFVLADRGVLSRDLEWQVGHLQGGHFGHESQRPGPLFYLLDVLAPGVGWPVLILGLAGMLLAARRRGGAWLVLLAAFLSFFLVLSLWRTRFDRYLLPALPPLALGLAGGWLVAAEWWGERKKKRAGRREGKREGKLPWSRATATAVPAVLALLLFLPPASATREFLQGQGRPSTLQLAKAWILENRQDQGPYLAMELYTPALPRDKQVRLRLADPALPRLSPAQRERYLDLDPLPVVYLPFYSTEPHAGDFYYDLRHFLAYDYVVTSSLVRGRFERDPGRYPRQAEFYADLQKYAPAAQIFAPGPGHRGPEIRLHAITDRTRDLVASEKPALTQDVFRAAAAQVAGSHFQDFVRTVADHAMARGAAGQAAQYYQPLYETSPPERRGTILPAYAAAVVQAERWADAQPLLIQWIAQAPGDPQPEGYLGLALVRSGRTAEGAAHLRRCVELAEGSQPRSQRERALADWARARLEELAAVGAPGPGR